MHSITERLLILASADAIAAANQHLIVGISVAVVTTVVVALIAIGVFLFLHRTKKIVSFEHSSEIDEGTGLGNRYYLSRRYAELVKPEKRHEYAVICLFSDTEKLERIYGRDFMLEFIVYSSEIAQKYTMSRDVICRIPGVGIVMLAHIKDDTIKAEIPNLLRSISLFNEKKKMIDNCRTSAGVYRLKDTDEDIHEGVFNAWQSAERAYVANEDYAFCSDEMLAAFMEERRMRDEITRGFMNHEFVIYIQFYVDAYSTHIVGGEALTRWHHPEKGVLTPAKFIPFMEREDIITNMDYYCLEEVCKFLEEVYHHGIENFYVSCNFSRRTFSAYDFVDKCLEIFSRYDFPKRMIAFEMTESVNVKNISQANENALRLKELGIRLLLDDFGEGFASFFDLSEYPVDGLKLDKALVDNIATHKGHTILHGMTRMGHELNLTVIVEGVESDDQVKSLQEMNCDVIQGFRFHRPIPVWEAKEKLFNSEAVLANESHD